MSNIKRSRDRIKTLWADTPWEDVAAYIGPNAEKFRKVWEKQRGRILEKGYGNTWSFCWGAFLLSYVWFFYRKQWLAGAMLLGLPIIIAVLFPTVTEGLGGVAIIIALMGKSLYLQDAMPKIAKIRAAAPDDAARHAVLAAAGGTSKLAAIISGVVFVLSILALIASAVHGNGGVTGPGG